jgi:hypothetical protein
MSFLSDLGGYVGSAYGWLGKQARVIPGIGAVVAGVGSSAEALLKGGSVVTTLPPEGDGAPATQSFGAQLPKKAPSTLAVVAGSKIAGFPVWLGVLLMAGLVWQGRKKKGR